MRGIVGALAGLVVGGALVLIASGRVWATTTVRVPGASTAPVSVTGHAVEPSLPALGIALLALAAAVIAARNWMRRVIGGVIVVVAGLALGVSLVGRSSVSSALTSHEAGGLGLPAHGVANGWWIVAAVGGFVASLVGVSIAVRSGAWAAMGRKYEAPEVAAPARPAADPVLAAWDALDRGEDPTDEPV